MDRRLDRRIVDHRLQLFDPGVRGLDRGAGLVNLRHGRLERGIGALQLLIALVEEFVRGPALADQRRGAPQLLVREIQLGLVACDLRLAGDERLAGEFGRGLRLVELRKGFGRVDPRDNFSR